MIDLLRQNGAGNIKVFGEAAGSSLRRRFASFTNTEWLASTRRRTGAVLDCRG